MIRRVQNIYYMLAYAFQVLNEQGYKKIAAEDFDNTAELCAAILVRGVKSQIKRGLGKEYVSVTESLSSLRGKIEVAESFKTGEQIKRKMICSYDEFSVNSYMNRIIKSTLILLLRADIRKSRKKEIKKLLVYLDGVELIDIFSVDWNINYNRNNQTYRMLITICYLIVKGMLQTESDGKFKMMTFIDERRMHRLYEKFILEYYRKEHPEITANASQIPWQIESDNRELLPVMQSDIMLTYEGRTLIIDAKYYSHSLQQQYNRMTAYSNNLYQIFTYVKNKEGDLSNEPHERVSGMLLYAQTEEEGCFEQEYLMSGNCIAIRTLDLNSDFKNIKKQLDDIAEKYLKVKAA